MFKVLTLVLGLSVIGTGTHAQQQGEHPWGAWQSQHFQKHPLAGLIYTPSSKGKLDASVKGQEFRRRLLTLWATSAKFVLLGEQHDNPDHHRIQAWFIEQVAKTERSPTVVLEMVPKSYASQLNQYDLAKDPGLDDLAKRLEWEKRGWYTWQIYRPMAVAIAKNRLRMVAGSLDREATRSLSKSGLKSLSKTQINKFGLEFPLPENSTLSLKTELKNSHCGLLPARAIPAMSLVQRAKDGALADAMITTGYKNGSILIAGNGHVRKDRGVPLVLRNLLPGSSESTIGKVRLDEKNSDLKVRIPNSMNFALGLIEVDPEFENPTDYNLLNEDGAPLYDAVIFTPKADLTDNCAAMKKHFEKKKTESKSE